VVVVGAGLHRYGSFPEVSVPVMGTVAVRNALKDANMQWEDVQEAYCGPIGDGAAAAVLCYGKLIAEGPPAEISKNKKVIEVYLGEFLEVIKKEGVTVLLSEQNLKFALKLADRANIADNGIIKYQGGIAELKQSRKST
jgi:hypothetical protein